MTVLRSAAAERFLAKPDADHWAVLIYGADTGGVLEAGRSFVKALQPQSPEIVELSGDTLRDDPARLADELGAISMFSATRIIVVDGITETHAAPLIAALDLSPQQTWLLIRAGRLERRNKLVKSFEAANHAAVIACYEESAGELAGHVRKVLRDNGLAIADDALMVLADHLGGDRALAVREAEKLALYCFGRESVSVEDVLAVCGDSLTLTIDAVPDAVASGNVAAAVRDAARSAASGSWSALLPALNAHFARLQALRLQVDSGRSPSQAVDQARPPVFFKRKPSLVRQLTIWSSAEIAGSLASIADAVLKTRWYPELEGEVTERLILSLARRAEVLSHGRR